MLVSVGCTIAGGMSGDGNVTGRQCCTAAHTLRGGPMGDMRVTGRLTREDSLRGKSMLSTLARLSSVVTTRLGRKHAISVSKLNGFCPDVADRTISGPRRYATGGM